MRVWHGGAIIGALGALDDITVTQAATVAEMRRRQPEATAADLVSSGITVGREHIAATVNTLLLAYAGASMPLLLLFSISDQSLAMVANSEVIAVEIVRTLCGSIGLVAAVPLTRAGHRLPLLLLHVSSLGAVVAVCLRLQPSMVIASQPAAGTVVQLVQHAA